MKNKTVHKIFSRDFIQSESGSKTKKNQNNQIEWMNVAYAIAQCKDILWARQKGIRICVESRARERERERQISDWICT